MVARDDNDWEKKNIIRVLDFLGSLSSVLSIILWTMYLNIHLASSVMEDHQGRFNEY